MNEEEVFDEDEKEEKKRAKQFKKDFPLRKLNWDYVHELEYLIDYHVDFGQMLKKKLDKRNAEVKQAIEDQIFQMNDMFRMIKNKKKNTEHDRGWRNCSIYLKELLQKLGLDAKEGGGESE